jgi:FkbM family methyltransferase
MDHRARKVIRTVQTRAPWLPDAKALAQRSTRQLLRRPFEEDFRALPLLCLPAGAVHLDIGANRGQSIDAIRLYGNNPVVHAFEPNPQLADRLVRRFRRSADVTIYNVGLGDRAGSFDLFVPSYRGYVFDGLASLDEECARSWLTDQLFGYDERRLHIEVVACAVQRLDDLLCEPAFVKIDVQGYEHQVLQGARRTLAEHRPALLIEWPGVVVTTDLCDLGYAPFQYLDGALVAGHHGMMNTFFLHRDSIR